MPLPVSPVPVSVERRSHCPARDDHPVSSGGLPPVLALEITLAWWPAKGSAGDPAPDSRDEPGQPALGRSTHPRRTAEARRRCRVVDCRQVHGEGRASAIATWKAFLRNQAAGIDAMDFLVVSTAGFKLLLIPLTLPRQRRRLISQYRRSRCCTSRWPTALSKAPLH